MVDDPSSLKSDGESKSQRNSEKKKFKSGSKKVSKTSTSAASGEKKNAAQVQFEQVVKNNNKILRFVHRIQASLLNANVPREIVEKSAHVLQPSTYEEVVTERATGSLCGWPCCGNTVAPRLGEKYRISLKDRAVYDAQERNQFCSASCATSSALFRSSLSEEPVINRQAVMKSVTPAQGPLKENLLKPSTASSTASFASTTSTTSTTSASSSSSSISASTLVSRLSIHEHPSLPVLPVLPPSAPSHQIEGFVPAIFEDLPRSDKKKGVTWASSLSSTLVPLPSSSSPSKPLTVSPLNDHISQPTAAAVVSYSQNDFSSEISPQGQDAGTNLFLLSSTIFHVSPEPKSVLSSLADPCLPECALTPAAATTPSLTTISLASPTATTSLTATVSATTYSSPVTTVLATPSPSSATVSSPSASTKLTEESKYITKSSLRNSITTMPILTENNDLHQDLLAELRNEHGPPKAVHSSSLKRPKSKGTTKTSTLTSSSALSSNLSSKPTSEQSVALDQDFVQAVDPTVLKARIAHMKAVMSPFASVMSTLLGWSSDATAAFITKKDYGRHNSSEAEENQNHQQQQVVQSRRSATLTLLNRAFPVLQRFLSVSEAQIAKLVFTFNFHQPIPQFADNQWGFIALVLARAVEVRDRLPVSQGYAHLLQHWGFTDADLSSALGVLSGAA